jgi:hypothetical protein
MDLLPTQLCNWPLLLAPADVQLLARRMVAAQEGRVRPGTSHLERHQSFRGTDSETARRYGVAVNAL